MGIPLTHEIELEKYMNDPKQQKKQRRINWNIVKSIILIKKHDNGYFT